MGGEKGDGKGKGFGGGFGKGKGKGKKGPRGREDFRALWTKQGPPQKTSEDVRIYTCLGLFKAVEGYCV